MTSVRDYLKKKRERSDEKVRISYREKIKSHKFTIFYRTILVIILITAIIAALYVQWNNKIYSQAAVLSSVEISITQNSTRYPFQDIF